MLFLASRILDHDLNDETRLSLLANLQEKGMTPLIRSTRLSCYELALSGSRHVHEMERAISSSAELSAKSPYVRGDVFCFEDHVFFLIFGDARCGISETRAGIIYERSTTEPLRKLDSFCRMVSLCLTGAGSEVNQASENAATEAMTWRHDCTAVQQAFMRFVAKQDMDSLYTHRRRETARDRVRAAQLLDDPYTRYFLRCVKDAAGEGYAVGLSAAGQAAPAEFSVNKLIEVGLLQREVLVSCRKTEHTLFSLPSADALAAVTISEARCSECGARIVDEKIEEVIAPTQLASTLLEDGSWLVNRLHALLRDFGVPESEIAVEPPTGEGEARMMVNVCDEPFLLVLRDGDLTPSFARRAVDLKIGTEARHLVVIVTGTIQNEGRRYLLNFAKRLMRGGSECELIIGEGLNAATLELQEAFKRVSRKVLAEQLCELDDDLGFSVAQLLTTRLQLLRTPVGTTASAQLSTSASPSSSSANTSSSTDADAPVTVMQHRDYTIPTYITDESTV